MLELAAQRVRRIRTAGNVATINIPVQARITPSPAQAQPDWRNNPRQRRIIAYVRMEHRVHGQMSIEVHSIKIWREIMRNGRILSVT